MNWKIIIEAAGLFVIPLLTVLVPIFIGQRYGISQSKKSNNLEHTQVSSVLGAAFGLLAFMLAFTFQIVSNRYDDRKALLVEEVTNIRTSYLRAGLIPEPYKSQTRKLLVEYVNLRTQLATDYTKVNFVIAQSQQILDSCWLYCEKLGEMDRSSENYSLFSVSITDMVESYNNRITVAFIFKIPPAILWTLFTISFFTMLILGYQFGISGERNPILNIILSLIFAMVMFLILILDQPTNSLTKINQKPIFTLEKQLHDQQLNFGSD